MFLLIPDLYLFLYHQNIRIVLMSFFVIVYLFSILKSTKYLFLFFPFLLFIPIYIYYISLYKISINEHILGVIMETNVQEALQFLGSYAYVYIFLFIVWFVFCLWITVLHYKKPKICTRRTRYFILIIGTTYFLLNYYFNAQIANQIDAELDSNNTFLVEEENAFLADLKNTYPIGLVISGWYTYKEQKKINYAFEKNIDFKFNASQILKNNEKEIYVLVLGETSRRESWQLNGYSRSTNPFLSQQKNLINFTDFISVSNVTRQSIPMMLTRKPEIKVNRYDFEEKSVITAFKEAGFRTYWLSTQQKFGTFDTSTSVYAKEADEIVFLNKTGYQQAGIHDDVLVSELEKIVKQKNYKQFIVIHTLGSHYNYQHRYPEDFSQYKPDLENLKNYSLQDIRFKQELKNSYDNSILFSDYVLNNFIEILKKQKNSISFLLYSSDHGEDIFDEKCKSSGHGLETSRNFEIASFIWYSNSFSEKYANKIQFLKQNKDSKINHTAIFPTLIDAANISMPSENLERSILKPFKAYPRLIRQGGDYDQMQFIGECRKIK